MLIGISDQMGTRFDRLRCEVFQNLILSPMNTCLLRPAVATVLTVYGIGTHSSSTIIVGGILGCNSTYRLRYWNKLPIPWLTFFNLSKLQQYLPFTVCAEGCETAEEQSDDEVRTSQVPERSEGKTKVIRQQYLPFTVCAAGCRTVEEQSDDEVHTSQVPERSEGKTKVMRK